MNIYINLPSNIIVYMNTRIQITVNIGFKRITCNMNIIIVSIHTVYIDTILNIVLNSY